MLCYPIVDLRPRPDVIHLIVGFVELGIPRWDCMPPYSMGDWHLGPWWLPRGNAHYLSVRREVMYERIVEPEVSVQQWFVGVRSAYVDQVPLSHKSFVSQNQLHHRNRQIVTTAKRRRKQRKWDRKVIKDHEKQRIIIRCTGILATLLTRSLSSRFLTIAFGCRTFLGFVVGSGLVEILPGIPGLFLDLFTSVVLDLGFWVEVRPGRPFVLIFFVSFRQMRICETIN